MKNNINNEKVLLQFSGGKDSTACFLFLKQNNINFEAIHFTHSYAYDIPLQMTKKICSKYEVKLTIINTINSIGMIKQTTSSIDKKNLITLSVCPPPHNVFTSSTDRVVKNCIIYLSHLKNKIYIYFASM